MIAIKNELRQHSFLLGLVAILLLIKYVFLPLIDWQDSVVIENKNLNKKLQKSFYVINHEVDNVEFNNRLDELLNLAEPVLFPPAVEVEFKLSTQQKLEKALESRSLTLSKIAWQSMKNVGETNLKEYFIDTHIDGNTLKLVEFLIAIEEDKRFGINKFNIDMNSSKDNLGYSRARVTFYLYMKGE